MFLVRRRFGCPSLSCPVTVPRVNHACGSRLTSILLPEQFDANRADQPECPIRGLLQLYRVVNTPANLPEPRSFKLEQPWLQQQRDASPESRQRGTVPESEGMSRSSGKATSSRSLRSRPVDSSFKFTKSFSDGSAVHSR